MRVTSPNPHVPMMVQINAEQGTVAEGDVVSWNGEGVVEAVIPSPLPPNPEA